MNALQISLIILAVVVVVGLAFWNWWQERKYRKQWMSTFGRSAQVVRNGTGPTEDFADEEVVVRVTRTVVQMEPVDETLAENSDALTAHRMVDEPFDEFSGTIGSPVAEQHHPVSEPFEMTSIDAELPTHELHDAGLSGQDLPAPPVDELLEYVVRVEAREPIPGTAFTTLIEGQRIEGRHIRWLGYAEAQGKWTDIRPWRNQSFHHAAVAVQLADRQGAVTADLLESLCHDLRVLATRFHGGIECDPADVAAARAARLDRFCVEVDVLIGLNIVAPDGRSFSGAVIDQVAGDSGLELDTTGVYQRRNERGDVLYSLCNHEDAPFARGQVAHMTTSGITLLFEVPRIENGVAVFADMARLALQMADRLDGALVDDTGRTLTGAGLEKIQGQLVQIYQQMEAGQVPPGGRRAQRLFN